MCVRTRTLVPKHLLCQLVSQNILYIFVSPHVEVFGHIYNMIQRIEIYLPHWCELVLIFTTEIYFSKNIVYLKFSFR